MEMATGAIKDGKQEFAPYQRAYINSSLAIPANIQIRNFIIEGFDEMGRMVAEKNERKLVLYYAGWYGSNRDD